LHKIIKIQKQLPRNFCLQRFQRFFIFRRDEQIRRVTRAASVAEYQTLNPGASDDQGMPTGYDSDSRHPSPETEERVIRGLTSQGLQLKLNPSSALKAATVREVKCFARPYCSQN
jgi:hypothetical protein